MSDAALNVFAVHTIGDSLTERGFPLRGRFQTDESDVPRRVERAMNQSGRNRSTDYRSLFDGSTTGLSPAVSGITVFV